jgi:hypothetical protein
VTNSASSFLAIALGLGVFLIIVAIGWRSVQHRRILRMRDANGDETIIVAGEDDEVGRIVTTETAAPTPATAPSAVDAQTGNIERDSVDDREADAAGRDRLNRVVSSTE